MCPPYISEIQVVNMSEILQFDGGEPDIGASVPAYTEAIQQGGFAQALARLLRELKAWADADPVLRTQPAEIIRRVLEMENDFVMDAGVAGIAAQNIAFLYAILGAAFVDWGRPFQEAMEYEAEQAEQAYEEAIQEQMQETGCDRLEAVQFMEDSALEYLQDRQEQVVHRVESLIESR
jgi:hypothetical protein